MDSIQISFLLISLVGAFIALCLLLARKPVICAVILCTLSIMQAVNAFADAWMGTWTTGNNINAVLLCMLGVTAIRLIIMSDTDVAKMERA